jgi:hypothetical protein
MNLFVTHSEPVQRRTRRKEIPFRGYFRRETTGSSQKKDAMTSCDAGVFSGVLHSPET